MQKNQASILTFLSMLLRKKNLLGHIRTSAEDEPSPIFMIESKTYRPPEINPAGGSCE